jgi:hypothetical protein
MTTVPSTTDAKALRKQLAIEYAATGGEGVRIIDVAVECYSRLREAQTLLANDGLVVPGRDGPKQHPACVIERSARRAYLDALRALADLSRTKRRVGRPGFGGLGVTLEGLADLKPGRPMPRAKS